MSRFPSITSRDLIRFLKTKGFYLDRHKGSSHAIYRNEKGISVPIPIHKGKDIVKGTAIGIIEQAGFPTHDFINWKNKGK